MRVNALITGCENIKGNAKSDGKPFDFWKVNFIDYENSAGSPQSVSLPKDPVELAKCLPIFEANRMKQLEFHVHQNGNYANFGGFITAAK